jgi:quaternary ammonium compound-resistance protein SugE
MPWVILVLAGFFEVCWAIGMKLSNGFTNVRWTAFTATTLVISMGLLAQALRTLPVGTAYAVWTGIGAVGTALLGMVLLGEPRTAARIFFIVLIVVGIVGLRSVTRSPL